MSQPASVSVVVSAVIENSEGKILLAKRSPDKAYPDLWEDVGGGLEPNEKPEDGLLREIREETGLSDIEIVKPLTVFHFFHGGKKDTENEIVGISYWCRTKTNEIILSDEHIEYRWVSPKEAVKYPLHEALRKLICEIFLQEKALEERISLLKLGRE